MTDTMRFSPPSVTVDKGETVRFVFTNSSQPTHELVLDTAKELREHAELMSKCPEMERGRPDQVSVQPGKTGELIWRFTKAGSFDFAGLQPGRLDADAPGRIVVN